MMKSSGPSLFLLIVLSACGKHDATQSSFQRASIPGTIPNRLELGQAYDSDSATWGNLACVTGTVSADLEKRGSVEYVRDMTYADKLRDLSGSLSVDVPFPSVKVSAEAEYAAKNTASEFRETHTIRFKTYKTKKLSLGTIAVSPLGNEYATRRQRDLRARCKNEFVNEINLGATFDATMSLEFKSKEEREKFGGSLKVDILNGAVKVEGKLAFATEEQKKSVNIRLSATQVGGDPKEMASILTPDVASCDAANLAPCISAFRHLIAYAGTIKTQLTSDADYSIIHYHTASYADTGLEALMPKDNPIVTEITALARERLETRLRQARFDVNRTNYLLAANIGLNTVNKATVEKANADAEWNRSRLFAALLYCYENPYTVEVTGPAGVPETQSACDNRKSQMEAELRFIDPVVFEIGSDAKANAACEKARLDALGRQDITREEYDAHKRLNWAPDYVSDGRPESGIVGWFPCAEVAREL